MKTIMLILVLLAAALAACAAPGAAPDTTPTPVDADPVPPQTGNGELTGTRWVLESYGAPGAEVAAVPGTEVTLSFEADGQAVGSAGCNSYGGQYTLQNGTVRFQEIIRTLMLCAEDAVNQQEELFLSALDAAGDYEVEGDRLRIYFNNRNAVLNFNRQ
jgi:heat shock protein HslJ